MADELRHVRRHYAHFHRVLGELLTQLLAEERVWWVGDKQEHTINPDGENNVYGKAVYTLPTLEPYQTSLNELRAVQLETMTLLGKSTSRPNAAITLPVILFGVETIRINRVHKRITEPLTKPQALGRMDRLINHQRTNLDAFRRYQTFHDPRLEAVAQQVQGLEDAKAFIQASNDDTFRFRTAQLEVRAYTYLQDGSVQNVYVTDHGLLAVGASIHVSFNTNTRKPRADQVRALPFYQDDHVRIYEERVWQEGKGV